MTPERDLCKRLAGLFWAVCASEGVLPNLGVSLVASLGAKGITTSILCKQKSQENPFARRIERTKVLCVST